MDEVDTVRRLKGYGCLALIAIGIFGLLAVCEGWLGLGKYETTLDRIFYVCAMAAVLTFSASGGVFVVLSGLGRTSKEWTRRLGDRGIRALLVIVYAIFVILTALYMK